MTRVGQWLRRTFIAGFFLTVPLAVSVVALVWLVQFADAATSGLSRQIAPLFGLTDENPLPYVGILVTATAILVIGMLARSTLGQKMVGRGQELLLHVPVFRTIYVPVKQLLDAFSPDNAFGFKRVVMVEHPARGMSLGFLTKEFTTDRGNGPETLLAVYVPTNHLYLGDVIVCETAQASFPDLTVEQGVRIFLTGGMALPDGVTFGRSAAAGAQPGRRAT
jgi:uncharacterized membrane protein